MNSKPHRLTVAFAAAAVLSMIAGPSPAAASGPFAGQDGRWLGSGAILLSSGTREPIRCRAQNIVTDDGHNLQQALRCASDSYKFEVNAYVDHDDGSISGHWDDLTNKVSGRIDGRLTDRRVDAMIRATGFTARLRIDMTATRQSVVITLGPERTDVAEVKIDLNRQ